MSDIFSNAPTFGVSPMSGANLLQGLPSGQTSFGFPQNMAMPANFANYAPVNGTDAALDPTFMEQLKKIFSMDSMFGGKEIVDGKVVGSSNGWAGTGINALQTLGNLWGSYQTQKLARDQFDVQRNTTNRNLSNQAKMINSIVDQRAQHQGTTQGLSEADTKKWAADYYNKNKVSGAPV